MQIDVSNCKLGEKQHLESDTAQRSELVGAATSVGRGIEN